MKFYDAITIVVFMLLAIISLQESILEELERTLGNHMIIEHMLFFVIGALSVKVAEIALRTITVRERKRRLHIEGAEKEKKMPEATATISQSGTATYVHVIQYWKTLVGTVFRLNKYAWIWIIIAILLMSVWHIPDVFDYAFTHSQVHILQHISFIIVGAATFLTIRILGESFNLFLLLSLIGMMGFAGLIFVIMDGQIYRVYSITSHQDAGIYMIISSILLLLVITPVYLIRRTMLHLKARS
jgi:hypothetical protein